MRFVLSGSGIDLLGVACSSRFSATRLLLSNKVVGVGKEEDVAEKLLFILMSLVMWNLYALTSFHKLCPAGITHFKNTGNIGSVLFPLVCVWG